jgi:hypothetical protein
VNGFEISFDLIWKHRTVNFLECLKGDLFLE